MFIIIMMMIIIIYLLLLLSLMIDVGGFLNSFARNVSKKCLLKVLMQVTGYCLAKKNHSCPKHCS